MKHPRHSQLRVATAVLAAHSMLLIGAFFVLAAVFEFPAVLREPPLRILELFLENQTLVQPTYYVFTLTGLTFIAMSVVVHEALGDRDSSWSRFALVTGVLAGLTQAIGFIRWVWLVPTLATIATDPAASDASRDAALVVFESMHQFAGVSVGENLSFWFQGLWSIAVGVTILRHGRYQRILGHAGIATGLGFILYTAEQFGGVFSWLGELNVVLHVAWLAWLVLLGLAFFKASRQAASDCVVLGHRTLIVAALLAGSLFASTFLAA